MLKMSPKVLSCWVLVVMVFIIRSSVSPVDIEQPIVKTSTATFLGKRLDIRPHQLPNDYHRSVSAFTRIPYAEPPVGQLRFTSPVARVVKGEFDATQTPVACPQKTDHDFWKIELDFSEDCLTLDVFVPEPKPKDAAVMMWIHGGGYHLGAGSIPELLPAPLAAYNDVIVVTINYRLGPLGFLATGDGSIPANIGMLDQRQALIWIQDNIEAFGGDPNRVTIFGESAGSASVNLHLLSTMSAGLFSRAIMQSGALTDTWTHHATMFEVVKMTYDMGKTLGCDVTTSSALVRCLRAKPVEDFITIYEGESPGVLSAPFYFHPVADGQFLSDDPIKMASEGSFNQVNVMVGCTKDEGSVFTLPMVTGGGLIEPPSMNLSTFRQMIAMNLRTQDPLTLDLAQNMFATPEQLADPDADYLSSVNKLIGDKMMLCPTFGMSEDLSRAGRNVYSYVMTHNPAISVWGSQYDWLGASHTEDIPYVFGAPFLRLPEDPPEWAGKFGNEQEVQMSLQTMKYWSNFAKTGDPNLSSNLEDAAGSKYTFWSKSTPSDPSYKELSPSFESRAGTANAKECYFLNKLVPSLLKNADEMAHLKSLLEEKVKETSQASCVDPQSCPEQ
ncbi:cholinesterase 1-like [Strongylocentrotus purpuratus]|uniref:Carboxylic ester hydrolase n=1 Tax=Strongylocentrotus purpuratus TaxID=7668 RepID=A0A7M7NXX0_STRPU|nr:cholinesterase 1-like [Strongylocentrotus purpuratus]